MIKQKIKPRSTFVKVRELLIRLLIISVIIFIALFFILKNLKQSIGASDYFKIKDIIVSQSQEGFDTSTAQNLAPKGKVARAAQYHPERFDFTQHSSGRGEQVEPQTSDFQSEVRRRIDFSYLKGRNIFDVNLKQEARYISELYPAYSKVGLVRILPNRLYVGFLIRKPLAYVKLHRYFYIDKEMVLLDIQKAQEEINLPLILGLETKISRPAPGEPYKSKELKVALDIIKEAKKNILLRDYSIKQIDLINPANTSFFVLLPFALPDYPGGNSKAKAEAQDLEVRIGQDNISDKIRILAGIFMNMENDLSKIKYIDLRFKEPVVKFK